MIEIRWLTGDARGTRDLIPSEWFDHEGKFGEKGHYVENIATGAIDLAKCALEVKATEGILDYAGDHRSYNRDAGFDIGQMKIVFDDSDHTSVSTVSWRTEGGHFKPAKVSVQVADQEDILTAGIASEGSARVARHIVRERCRSLRNRKILSVTSKGEALHCEACGFDFAKVYPSLGVGFCEVHHVKWLATGGVRDTPLADLAILCANCHRMIHRSGMLSVADFAKLVKEPTDEG